jgi:TRAP-type C4-dicarboxylate transport system permease small subunit
MESLHDAGGGGAPAAVRWLARAEVAVAGLLLLGALGITLTTIVERNLGHSTGDWSLKLPELILAWLTFLGMGGLVTERGHVAADMFLRLMPPRWQKVSETLADLITAGVLAAIFVGAVMIVRQQMQIDATDEELWDVPAAALLAILPIGLALTILHLLVDVWVVWRVGPRELGQPPERSGS